MGILIGAFVLGVVCYGVIALYSRFYKSRRIEILRQMLMEKQTYANGITENKIVIAGGSEVLYSFDTDFLSEQLGTPAVNLGSNVGFGAAFIMDRAKECLRSGDTLVLSLAYGLYDRPMYDVFAYEYFRMYDREQFRRFSWKERAYYMMKNVVLNRRFEEKFFDMSPSGFYRNVMGSELPPHKNVPLQFADFAEGEVTAYLLALKKYCEFHDIKLYITYPDTVYFAAYETEPFFEHLEGFLKQNFSVIGNASSYMYDSEYFYNSVYHVNKNGQRKRTNDLLKALRKEQSIGNKAVEG
ncbi:hypothetical protein PGRAN_07491 [Listeria grandensis FSL F6-0971]|uniref:Uncharacterized protein n=1 Tax=Listeria grandensis FSL F6-0971 TaxID=1265819 RepID=W7BTS4_9LIST|nr:hypothetical protein [Listeria grandensis]EUJ23728.1 hypothetical protein PGRAN_07491 [Listeria grandensis FSL F6-0971]